jgi:hypothetical protein
MTTEVYLCVERLGKRGRYHLLTNTSGTDKRTPFELEPVALATCAMESQSFELALNGVEDPEEVTFFFMGVTEPSSDERVGRPMSVRATPKRMCEEEGLWSAAVAPAKVYIRAVISSVTSPPGEPATSYWGLVPRGVISLVSSFFSSRMCCGRVRSSPPTTGTLTEISAGVADTDAFPARDGSRQTDAKISELVQEHAEIAVQHFFERTRHVVSVRPELEVFLNAVRRKFGFSEKPRLFFFRPGVKIAQSNRTEVACQADYASFLASWDKDPSMVLYIHPNSADNLPKADPYPYPPSHQKPQRDGDELSAASSGSSAVHRALVRLVRFRDEKHHLPHICVVCGASPSTTEVAHVVARSTDLETAYYDYGLVNGVDVPSNAFQACATCHFWYDQKLWWVEIEGSVERIVVSAELLADEESLPEGQRHFTLLHGKNLRLPPVETRGLDWPSADLWKVQKRLCEEARIARHKGAKRNCARCNKPYYISIIPSLRKHEKFCKASPR